MPVRSTSSRYIVAVLLTTQASNCLPMISFPFPCPSMADQVGALAWLPRTGSSDTVTGNIRNGLISYCHREAEGIPISRTRNKGSAALGCFEDEFVQLSALPDSSWGRRVQGTPPVPSPPVPTSNFFSQQVSFLCTTSPFV